MTKHGAMIARSLRHDKVYPYMPETILIRAQNILKKETKKKGGGGERNAAEQEKKYEENRGEEHHLFRCEAPSRVAG